MSKDFIAHSSDIIKITLPWSRDTLQRPMYRAFEAREGK